jgi:hypothetical protein
LKLDFTKHGTDLATGPTGFLCCLIGILFVLSVVYTLFTSEASEFPHLLELFAFGIFCLVIGIGLARYNWGRSH